MDVVLNILKTFYESLWISLILAFLFSVSGLYAEGIKTEVPGWKGIFTRWIEKFRSLKLFRHRFYLYIYTAMLLYQTLLGREIWPHPLEAVFGNWALVNAAGDIGTQIFENLFIFTPFIILLFWAYGEKVIKGNTLWSYLLSALKITAVFSFLIEVLQAVLHLGTLQISDFCYNVVGGVIGGLIYWCGYKIKHRRKREKNNGR